MYSPKNLKTKLETVNLPHVICTTPERFEMEIFNCLVQLYYDAPTYMATLINAFRDDPFLEIEEIKSHILAHVEVFKLQNVALLTFVLEEMQRDYENAFRYVK